MRAQILTVVGMGIAAVAFPATAAVAAPAAKSPAPSVADTSQTLTLSSGGQSAADTVTFTSNTWSLASVEDTGKFTDKGSKLVLKTTSSVDKGCTYKGTYDAATTLYEGTYKCPAKSGGYTGTFTVTTAGVTDAARAAARTHGPSFIR